MKKPANEIGSLNAWQARRRGQLHKPRVSRSKREDRTLDGITFASKAEMLRYQELELLRESGEIRWFIRQPRFDVLGAVVTADFLIVWSRPFATVTVEDAKGKGGHPDHLRRFERNRKQVFQKYGVEIEVVER